MSEENVEGMRRSFEAVSHAVPSHQPRQPAARVIALATEQAPARDAFRPRKGRAPFVSHARTGLPVAPAEASGSEMSDDALGRPPVLAKAGLPADASFFRMDGA